MIDFNKSYDESELQLRNEIFNKNLAEIFIHNADESKTWKTGVNEHTDLTHTEFK